MNVRTNETVWALPALDDTDATIVVEAEDGIPYLYTGTEVDKQGSKGYAYLRKINGLTGKVVWQMKYECLSVVGGDHPVNGGVLATPVIGKGIFPNSSYSRLPATASSGKGSWSPWTKRPERRCGGSR